MKKRMKKVILQKGNNVALPQDALNMLNVNEGDELVLIYTEDMIALMLPEKFGEKILKN